MSNVDWSSFDLEIKKYDHRCGVDNEGKIQGMSYVFKLKKAGEQLYIFDDLGRKRYSGVFHVGSLHCFLKRSFDWEWQKGRVA